MLGDCGGDVGRGVLEHRESLDLLLACQLLGGQPRIPGVRGKKRRHPVVHLAARVARLGMSISTVAAIALAAVSPWPNPFAIAGVAFLLGFGLGWSAAPTLIAAQASVGWGERGAVTGMNAFARSAGSAVGVAVFGAISNSVIAQGRGPDDPDTIIHASVWVFVAVAVTAVLTLCAAALMPKDGAVSSPAP